MAFEKLEPARDSSEKTTVFLHSTHEALEMDMAKLFAEGGLKVTGIFCGEPIQRPKLRWIARAGLEPKSPERSRVERMAATKADIGERAVYVAMNNSDLVRRCRFFADLGIPVVAHLVGQTDDEKLASLAATMRSSSLVWAVSYSLKERDALARFLSGSTAIERLRIIRFGMDRRLYDGWTGELESVLTLCNSYGKRKEACSWDAYFAIVEGLPATLAGHETEDVGGVGELTYRSIRKRYRRHRCYLAMGTRPAPMTMSLAEAMTTGCPTAAYDNGCGIAEEGVFSAGVGLCSSDPTELRSYLRKLLREPSFAKEQSEACAARAREFFSWEDARDAWREVITDADRCK